MAPVPLTPRDDLAPNDFVHLHTHSEFSLLDGLGRITDLVDTTSSTASTRSPSPTTAPSTGPSRSTRPPRRRASSRSSASRPTSPGGRCGPRPGADSQPFHLILLATDIAGYRNLCRLITDAHIDGYYYKPRIDREHLAKYSEGLVGLSAPASAARSPRRSRRRTGTSRAPVAGEYGDILGKDRFFLELQDHGIPEQHRLNEQLLRLAPEVGLPLVVTNDLHYVHREQHEAHDVLLCVGHRQQPRHARTG